jgi:hypothetical protein
VRFCARRDDQHRAGRRYDSGEAAARQRAESESVENGAGHVREYIDRARECQRLFVEKRVELVAVTVAVRIFTMDRTPSVETPARIWVVATEAGAETDTLAHAEVVEIFVK